jgi:lipase chaperone LimK
VQDVGAAAAGDILAVWDRYLALQHHRWATTADPSDALSVQRALSERRQVRREHLGPAWADAFYAAEEAQLRADLAAAGTAVPRPESDPLRAPPALADAQARALLHQQRVVQYGEDAARRLADLDAAEADWQRRLSQARGEIARIQQSPELSQPQRQQAIERHLTEAFTATEQRRARALLELTPSASTAAR